MTRFTTARSLAITLLLGAAVALPVRAGEVDPPLTLQEWSRLVWDSASRGDQGQLDDYLSELPGADDTESARVFRAALDRHRDNRAEALANRRPRHF